MSTLQVSNLNEIKFCTYVTFYRGNKLPPFYIGYTKIDNINKGYRGSVSSKRYKDIWKEEKTKNPELFVTKVISVHDNKEEAKSKEESLQKRLNVIKNPLYINRAIGHHYDNTGNKHSEETKLNYSLSRKGRPGPNKGKKRPGVGGVKKGNIPWNKGLKGAFNHTEEHKQKISESMKNYVEVNGVWNKGIETGPRKTKGMYRWYYNEQTKKNGLFAENEQPAGWTRGITRTKVKRIWFFNPLNQTETVFVEEIQKPEGWLRGRGITGKKPKGNK